MSTLLNNSKVILQLINPLYTTVNVIAPDKDWRQLGIYPPLFDLIGYF